MQILQKHQTTPFPHPVKKSLFLTFFHISVIWQICHFHHFPQFIKNHHFSPFYEITKNHHFYKNASFTGNAKNTQIC